MIVTEKDAKNIIEVLLFVAGSPLPLKKIGEILEIDPRIVRSLIIQLQQEYESSNKGIRIIEIAYGYQMVTQPEYVQWIERLLKKQQEGKMSVSALEALAIIAYNQPITKAEIERIRGVNSAGAIQKLLEKKLIKVVGKKKIPGHPLLYGTTLEFLKSFGLKDLSSLPDFDKMVEDILIT